MLAFLLACWSPDPGAAPVQLADLDPVLIGPGEDDPEAAPEGPPDRDTDPAPDDDTDPTPLPPFDSYPATTTSAPVTVVDDYGKPVTVIQRAGVAVTVVAEDPIRKRVICSACAPLAEGWVQPSVVTGRP